MTLEGAESRIWCSKCVCVCVCVVKRGRYDECGLDDDKSRDQLNVNTDSRLTAGKPRPPVSHAN